MKRSTVCLGSGILLGLMIYHRLHSRRVKVVSAPMGWMAADAVSLLSNGYVHVHTDKGNFVVHPSSVRVVVEGEYRPDVLDAISLHCFGQCGNGWWRSSYDMGGGEVLIYVKSSTSDLRRQGDM